MICSGYSIPEGESLPLASNPLFFAPLSGSVPPPGCSGCFSATPSLVTGNYLYSLLWHPIQDLFLVTPAFKAEVVIFV